MNFINPIESELKYEVEEGLYCISETFLMKIKEGDQPLFNTSFVKIGEPSYVYVKNGKPERVEKKYSQEIIPNLKYRDSNPYIVKKSKEELESLYPRSYPIDYIDFKCQENELLFNSKEYEDFQAELTRSIQKATHAMYMNFYKVYNEMTIYGKENVTVNPIGTVVNVEYPYLPISMCSHDWKVYDSGFSKYEYCCHCNEKKT